MNPRSVAALAILSLVSFTGLAAGAGQPGLARGHDDSNALNAVAKTPQTAGVTSTASSDGAWKEFPQLARGDAAAIYDPANDRVVVFGGSSPCQLFNDVWTLSMATPLRWTRLSPVGTAPLRRITTAVYDATRGRMLFFGGWSSDGYKNDVWELTLGATPTWNELFPTGTPPVGRLAHGVIYDPVRDRLVVFGGRGKGVPPQLYSDFFDTWELTLGRTPAWNQLSPVGAPPSTTSGQAFYDPDADQMVVIGRAYQSSSSCYDAAAWTLSLGDTPTWTAFDPSGTPPQGCQQGWGITAAFDVAHHRVIGAPGWTLTLGDNPAWTSTAPGGLVAGSSMVYDSNRNVAVLFGGAVLAPGDPIISVYDDAWTFAPDASPAWTRLVPVGGTPSTRIDAVAVYDAPRDRMILFGGRWSFYGAPSSTTWELPLGDASPMWTELATSGMAPGPRAGATAIVDPVRDRMIVFGGDVTQYPGSPVNGTWALDLASAAWSALQPTGTPPPAGAGYMSIYDPMGDRMMVTNGAHTWALTLSGTPAWSSFPTANLEPPPARQWGSAIYDPVREQVVIFGGYDGSGDRNDVWALRLDGIPTWVQMAQPATVPSPRDAHVAIYDPVRDRMVVNGGNVLCIAAAAGDSPEGVGICPTGETWALSLGDNPAWTRLSPSGACFSNTLNEGAGIYDPTRDQLVATNGQRTSALVWGEAPVIYHATVGIMPRAFNLKSHGWLTVSIAPSGFDASDVDVSSIRLNGSVAPDPKFPPAGGHGSASLMVKFSRDDVAALLKMGTNDLVVTGSLASGGTFRGTGSVRVGDTGTAMLGPSAAATPTTFSLRDNRPNPFNPETSIRFDTPRAAHVRVVVYDALGRAVSTLLDTDLPAGSHDVTWRGRDDRGREMASGVYFVRMEAGSFSATRKMLLLK